MASLTPEQDAAIDALDMAVENGVTAFVEPGDPRGQTQAWATLVVTQIPDSDPDSISGICDHSIILFRPSLSRTMLRGMLEMALDELR